MGTVVCAHTSYVDPPVPGPYFECTYDYHMYPNALVRGTFFMFVER